MHACMHACMPVHIHAPTEHGGVGGGPGPSTASVYVASDTSGYLTKSVTDRQGRACMTGHACAREPASKDKRREKRREENRREQKRREEKRREEKEMRDV